MRRFLKKVVTFFLVISIVTLSVNYIYMKLDKSDSSDVNKFADIPSDIKVCNFGSSHGLYGFNYEDVKDVECFNFGLSAQYLSYDKRLFEEYKDNIDGGAVVFLPVSYFSLFGKSELTEDVFEEKNRRYYRILPPELIKEYDWETDIYMNDLPSLTADTKLFRVLLGRPVDDGSGVWFKTVWEIDVAEDAKGAYERHIVTDKFDENGKRIVNEEEVDALVYLIEACKEKGATPILITTPFLKEYTDAVSGNDEEFYSEFYGLVNEIVEQTGVDYYDYAFDERFVKNYDWFMNSDYLNKEGARQFVNILMSEVVSRVTLQEE